MIMASQIEGMKKKKHIANLDRLLPKTDNCTKELKRRGKLIKKGSSPSLGQDPLEHAFAGDE
ncbi:MAG: hypothetical protein COA36_06720 [Desulfotalea sp.]|nr:MAG: hypothetical protein COA36_06720 [Desulfotalea sp.]